MTRQEKFVTKFVTAARYNATYKFSVRHGGGALFLKPSPLTGCLEICPIALGIHPATENLGGADLGANGLLA